MKHLKDDKNNQRYYAYMKNGRCYNQNISFMMHPLKHTFNFLFERFDRNKMKECNNSSVEMSIICKLLQKSLLFQEI